MGEIQDGPCTPWLTLHDLELAPGFNPDKEIEPMILSDAIDVASYILYEFSGRQYPGLCEIATRPCRAASWGFYGNGIWSSNYPNLGFGWNPTWGDCGCGAGVYSDCGCGNIDQITLGAYPLVSITSVKIDGAVLDPSKYRIDDFNFLVRTDGQLWPVNQDLSKASSEVGTFEVTFKYGHSIPTAAKSAARRLAMEFAKNYAGKSCKLPERVQTVTRQNVSYVMLDTAEYFTNRKTGIYEVDAWLTAVNPKGRSGSAAIISPDVSEKTRRINT